MHSNLNISKKTAVCIYRIIAVTSLLFTVAILLVLMLVGIPFNHQQANYFNAIDFFFDSIFYAGKQSFAVVVGNVGFVVTYYSFLVVVFVSLIKMLISVKKWFLDVSVTKSGKTLYKNSLVDLFNSTLWKYTVLMILSYFCCNYKISNAEFLTIGCFITAYLLINLTYLICGYENIFKGIVVALSQAIILFASFMFCYFIELDIPTLWDVICSLPVIFDMPTFKAGVYVLVLDLIVPLTLILSVISMLRRSYESVVRSEYIERECRTLFICCACILGCILIANGIIFEYKQVLYYLEMIYENLQIVLIPAALFLASSVGVEKYKVN